LLLALVIGVFKSDGLAFGVGRDRPSNAAKGGGRAPGNPDVLSTTSSSSTKWQAVAPKPSEAKLTIVQVTDVYTLEHFASLKTLLAQAREQSAPGKVISMLTGDFLAPYLLSSVDRGAGMMNAISKVPIDYVTWGNHEADIDHRTVCRHVRNFPGTWLNTNMQDHEAMDCQEPFDIVEVTSPDGTNTRRVGLVAVLSNDPGLYSHFKPPGAFGGATIRDPWVVLAEYKELLEGPEYQCDIVIPLQHTYVPDDHRTCREFDFPVVLSGHDHHRVDEIVQGTRLLKPGLDAIYATILELSWLDGTSPKKLPEVSATFVRCSDWQPDPVLEEENERAYNALTPLRNTELARVPPAFEPLSSTNSRGKVTSMGCFICSLLRSALTVTRRQRQNAVDAVLLMGGNIRGGTDYPSGSFFSLEMLEAEIKSDETIAVVEMPGRVLAEGVAATHSGDPIPGWFQYDIGVTEEYFDDKPPVVTHVGGQPIEMDRIYRVATKISDLTNGQSKPFTDYYTARPDLFPSKGAYTNIHAELMGYFARNLWRKIWDNISPTLNGLCEPANECDPEGRLEKLDLDEDGIVGIDEIHAALRDVVGLSVDENEKSLAQFVHSFADTTGDGQVTIQDFELFCDEMPHAYKRDEWRLAYSRSTASVQFTAKTK
jgi:2',3'-cyclic-nucleotide 2'-phosphodiesterase (5'-nucleotidase family)